MATEETALERVYPSLTRRRKKREEKTAAGDLLAGWRALGGEEGKARGATIPREGRREESEGEGERKEGPRDEREGVKTVKKEGVKQPKRKRKKRGKRKEQVAAKCKANNAQPHLVAERGMALCLLSVKVPLDAPVPVRLRLLSRRCECY